MKPTYQRVLDRLTNQELAYCWRAIREGGLGNAKEINGIPTDEWIERVYVEMSNRRLLDL